MIFIGIYAEGDFAAVANAIVVLVTAHIKTAKVALVPLVISVGAVGEPVAAFVAHMVGILVYTHFDKTSVAYAVVVFVGTHASATLITVVATVLAVNAEAVAAVVTAVILVLAVGTSAEDSFAYVTEVVRILVNTLADNRPTYIAYVVGIYVLSTL